SQAFIESLNVDDVIAHLLVAEGFTSVEEIAFVPIEELAEIEGFEPELAEELKTRAQTFVQARDERFTNRRVELGVADEIAAMPGMKPAILAALGESGVRSLDDLADLSGDELLEYAPDGALTLDQANEIIMAARAHWFEDEAPGETSAEAASSGPEAASPSGG
ncbi:MAG: helix-hairpin-helix domain-containing protein, partial [Rhodospirillales bacterium]